jgi:hypothetical protein
MLYSLVHIKSVVFPGVLTYSVLIFFAGSIGDTFFNSFNSKAHPIKTVLQDEPPPQQHSSALDNCFTSFMGNTSLPFDIQVCLFFTKYYVCVCINHTFFDKNLPLQNWGVAYTQNIVFNPLKKKAVIL